MESVSCSTGARSSVNIMSFGFVGTRLLIVLSNITGRSACDFGCSDAKFSCRL